MCNHYSTLKDAELVQRQFGVQLPAGDWKTDVYPGDSAPIIRRLHGGLSRNPRKFRRPIYALLKISLGRAHNLNLHTAEGAIDGWP